MGPFRNAYHTWFTNTHHEKTLLLEQAPGVRDKIERASRVRAVLTFRVRILRGQHESLREAG